MKTTTTFRGLLIEGDAWREPRTRTCPGGCEVNSWRIVGIDDIAEDWSEELVSAGLLDPDDQIPETLSEEQIEALQEAFEEEIISALIEAVL